MGEHKHIGEVLGRIGPERMFIFSEEEHHQVVARITEEGLVTLTPGLSLFSDKMNPLESQVWSATFGQAYIQAMEIGRHQGHEPAPQNCVGYAKSAVDIADSAVHAMRVEETWEDAEFA